MEAVRLEHYHFSYTGKAVGISMPLIVDVKRTICVTVKITRTLLSWSWCWNEVLYNSLKLLSVTLFQQQHCILRGFRTTCEPESVIIVSPTKDCFSECELQRSWALSQGWGSSPDVTVSEFGLHFWASCRGARQSKSVAVLPWELSKAALILQLSRIRSFSQCGSAQL